MSIWDRIKSLGKRPEPTTNENDDNGLEGILEECFQNSICLKIAGSTSCSLCATRFGGVPDIPADFIWPEYGAEGEKIPLHFLLQINCADLAALDKDDLLPKSGLLSFFYETEEQPWGFEKEHAGSARVFWFEDLAALKPAVLPCGTEPFPALNVELKAEKSLPEWDDFALRYPGSGECDAFEEARVMLGVDIPDESSKLLGWPDLIQGSVYEECAAALKDSHAWDWKLLFQLDTVTDGDFELMFGDSGRIYFCIREDDLEKKNFNNIWTILQCY